MDDAGRSSQFMHPMHDTDTWALLLIDEAISPLRLELSCGLLVIEREKQSGRIQLRRKREKRRSFHFDRRSV